MADDMDVDPPATGSAKNTKDDVKDKKRFEVKKVLGRSLFYHLPPDPLQWNAVALWAWGAHLDPSPAFQVSHSHRHRGR